MPVGTKILFWFEVSLFAMVFAMVSSLMIYKAEEAYTQNQLKPLIQQHGITTQAEVLKCEINGDYSKLYYQFMATEPITTGQTAAKTHLVKTSVIVPERFCWIYSVKGGQRQPLLIRYLPEYPTLPIFMEHDDIPNLWNAIKDAISCIMLGWPIFIIGVYKMYKSWNEKYSDYLSK